jgi:hypothetical protein
VRTGLVAIVGALALAAALPAAAVASQSCEVEVTAGSDLAPGAATSTEPNYSCAIREDCPSSVVSCSHYGTLYASVSGVGQVGMRVEETAGGNRSECVGVLGCSATPTAADPWHWGDVAGGQTRWVVCTLQNFAAVNIRMTCTVDTSF